MAIRFEFDPAKSASNKLKHGIDFIEAQALWLSRRVEAPTKSVDGEVRYAVIGMIRGVHHIAIITYRGSSVRIISARSVTAAEKGFYEQQIKTR